MSKQSKYYPKKWRPSLGMIVSAMLVFVLALPLGGIWLFRFYDNQLLRETENELIIQAAFIQAIINKELEEIDFPASSLPNKVISTSLKGTSLAPLLPSLDLTKSPQLERRAAAQPTSQTVAPVFSEIGRKLTPVMQDAQQITLAGFRVLDSNGVVIAGRNEVGMSLAHVLEVREALNGQYSSVIRERTSQNPRPPIYSISRGTNIRVFVAMPIEYQGRVAGVAYLSRTPSHFLRELYDQRWKIVGAGFFMLLVTMIIAMIFVRTIKGPIEALNNRMKRIGQGDRTALSPLPRHGSKEIAELADGLFSMSEKLQDRTDYIRTFANHVSHELKSPLTSIQGAAELIKDSGDTMSSEKRSQFLDNIHVDTKRLTDLLIRLRDLAATEAVIMTETTDLSTVLRDMRDVHDNLEITFSSDQLPSMPLAISAENLHIILENFFENSMKHNATRIAVSAETINDTVLVTVSDNGSGISKANLDKVLDMFFTTRRDEGGTGMGLNIIQSMLKTHGGELRVLPSDDGAKFQFTLPIAS